jgi:ankyrin repeat protein
MIDDIAACKKRQGADESEGGSPLFWAVTAGDRHRVQLLLEHGADPEQGYDDITPLMQASTYQVVGIMQELIAAGADINRRDNEGRPALMHALMVHAEFPLLVLDDWIREAHVKRYPKELSLPVTRLLISSGAEYEGADNKGFSAADYALLAHLNRVELPEELKLVKVHLRFCRAAIAGGSSELASSLAAKNIPRRLMSLALHLAATRGHVDCCKVLLEQGADADGIDIFGNHPVGSAAVGLHTPVVQLLIGHGVTMEGINRALLTTCMVASHQFPEHERNSFTGRRLELARYLLEQGADPNYRDGINDAPLKQAIGREEDCELVEILLKYGADPTD